MNRWELASSGASVLLTFSLLLSILSVQKGEATSSNIRQRSDGCGPHPLIALAAASRPFGTNGGASSLNDVLRTVRADPVVWPVMQNLLRRYDDCIRAADGLHYKRSDDFLVTGGYRGASSSDSSSLSPSPSPGEPPVPAAFHESETGGNEKNSGWKRGSKSSFNVASTSSSSTAAADAASPVVGRAGKDPRADIIIIRSGTTGNDIIPWLPYPV